MARVVKIEVKWDEDSYDDISDLGKFTDRPKARFVVNRKRGKLVDTFITDDDGEHDILADNLSTWNSSREYLCFEPMQQQNPGSPAEWSHCSRENIEQYFSDCNFGEYGIKPEVTHDRPMEFWLDIFYACRDYERANGFGDQWSYTTCTVKAVIAFDTELGERTEVHTVTSLCGIESDCGKEYRKEVEKDLIDEALATCKADGIKVDIDAIETVASDY